LAGVARGEIGSRGGFSRNGKEICTKGQGQAGICSERSPHTNAALDNNAKSALLNRLNPRFPVRLLH
jgi:hypothetical protein